MNNLNTKCKNTWCPGCANFSILNSFKKVIAGKKNIVLTAGIGCHAKIVDYINVSSFYSLHGRSIPAAEGIKLANPNLDVVAFTGDGDSLNEGIAHLIHAAKRNSDITVILHNNRLFALTTGQFTAASPKGFKGKSTPKGSPEFPLNPLELMLAANATFIARTSAFKPAHMEEVFRKAIEHKGFSFVEVLEPCISFYNSSKFLIENSYIVEEENQVSKIKEWNYEEGENIKIPLGIFKNVEKTEYYKEVLNKEEKKSIKEILDKKI